MTAGPCGPRAPHGVWAAACGADFSAGPKHQDLWAWCRHSRSAIIFAQASVRIQGRETTVAENGTGRDDPDPTSTARWSLKQRMPGQGVIEHLLALQGQQRPRPFIHRIFGVDPLAAGSHSWYKGALGEIAIGYLLTDLGSDWTVLHAVPVGAETADIDHVLIGPSGVFTINTKNHSGQSVWIAGHVMMVAGRKQRHLHNAQYEATRAANLLGRQVRATVPVTAVIVIRNPKSMTISDQPIGEAAQSARHQQPRPHGPAIDPLAQIPPSHPQSQAGRTPRRSRRKAKHLAPQPTTSHGPAPPTCQLLGPAKEHQSVPDSTRGMGARHTAHSADSDAGTTNRVLGDAQSSYGPGL